jgi:hypothetical protein
MMMALMELYTTSTAAAVPVTVVGSTAATGAVATVRGRRHPLLILPRSST